MFQLRKAFWAIAYLISATCYAESISGTYMSKDSNIKEVSIYIEGKEKVYHPDKKGRFTIKNADPDKDILIVLSPNLSEAVKISLGGMNIVEIQESKELVDINLKKRAYVTSSEYDGIILMQDDLLATGESNALAAVNVKYPISPTTTFQGNKNPLYFLDGVEVSDISYISIQETAYVEVVRASNPSCTAFGARGGNGLILLTTQTRYAVKHPEKDEPNERHIQVPVIAK